jgi:branched-chain amino acid transport system permease protein
LIYKSTSILNLAQGELMMVGAYICLSMTLDFGLNFFVSFIITMVFSVILGLAVERLVLRPLIGEPIISIIMVTLGLTYILRGLVIMLWGLGGEGYLPVPVEHGHIAGAAHLFRGFLQVCPYRRIYAGRGRSSDRGPEYGNFG